MSGTDVVVEAFTELAPRYEETMDQELGEMWGIGYEEFVDRLARTVLVKHGDLVLDVATGTAQIPIVTAGKTGAYDRIVGLDITLPMLEHGQEKVKARGLSRVCLVCASAMDMPFANGVFDIVICGLGMHHMDVLKSLSEMRRVLRNGGTLSIAAVGALSFWKTPWIKAIVRTIAWLHFLRTENLIRAWAEADALSHMHTASEWRTLLREFGFAEIEIAELPSRRHWYPQALFIRASKAQAALDIRMD